MLIIEGQLLNAESAMPFVFVRKDTLVLDVSQAITHPST